MERIIEWIIANWATIVEWAGIIFGLVVALSIIIWRGRKGWLWERVKEALKELADDAIRDVSEEDVKAVARYFWREYLADTFLAKIFGSEEKFAEFCWGMWREWVADQAAVRTMAARRGLLK